MNTYHIYSDGSCLYSGQPNAIATWSYVVTNTDGLTLSASTGRVIGQQNNNRAELFAYIGALQYVTHHKGKYIIHVDYETLYLYYMGKCRPRANADLYQQIDKLMRRCGDRVSVVKVQAHKPRSSIVNFINSLVDKLARRSVEFFGEEDALKVVAASRKQ